MPRRNHATRRDTAEFNLAEQRIQGRTARRVPAAVGERPEVQRDKCEREKKQRRREPSVVVGWQLLLMLIRPCSDAPGLWLLGR